MNTLAVISMLFAGDNTSDISSHSIRAHNACEGQDVGVFAILPTRTEQPCHFTAADPAEHQKTAHYHT